jgi:hypothetical protein
MFARYAFSVTSPCFLGIEARQHKEFIGVELAALVEKTIRALEKTAVDGRHGGDGGRRVAREWVFDPRISFFLFLILVFVSRMLVRALSPRYQILTAHIFTFLLFSPRFLLLFLPPQSAHRVRTLLLKLQLQDQGWKLSSSRDPLWKPKSNIFWAHTVMYEHQNKPSLMG